MADRRRYLVTYDIRNAGRLRRVHDVVLDYGDRLQYSVYLCDLTKVELVRLRRELSEEMNLSVDAVSLFDLGVPASRHAARVEHLGPEPSVPSGGHEVW